MRENGRHLLAVGMEGVVTFVHVFLADGGWRNDFPALFQLRKRLASFGFKFTCSIEGVVGAVLEVVFAQLKISCSSRS